MWCDQVSSQDNENSVYSAAVSAALEILHYTYMRREMKIKLP